jgi:branched-chain amino acid transport system substrate-binding protein
MGRRTLIGAATAISVTRPQAHAAGEPIRIGWMQALTGPSSAAGIGFHRGSVLATEAINAAGGVNGLRIPTQTSRRFRSIPAGDSDGSQPLIPTHSSHP